MKQTDTGASKVSKLIKQYQRSSACYENGFADEMEIHDLKRNNDQAQIDVQIRRQECEKASNINVTSHEHVIEDLTPPANTDKFCFSIAENHRNISCFLKDTHKDSICVSNTVSSYSKFNLVNNL